MSKSKPQPASNSGLLGWLPCKECERKDATIEALQRAIEAQRALLDRYKELTRELLDGMLE